MTDVQAGQRDRSLSRGARSSVVTVRRPGRAEVYLSVWPEGRGSLGEQLEDVYRELAGALEQAGASLAHVVWERLFLASPVSAPVAEALSGSGSWAGYRPARCAVLEPPCAPRRLCEIQAQAVIPLEPGEPRTVTRESPGGARAVVVERASGREIHLANVLGPPGGDFLDEATAMFERAEEELRSLGASFRDVARTWIHLADMARDYEELNHARRSFFHRQGLALFPASTGIGGPPAPPGAVTAPAHRSVLSLHAVAGEPEMTPLHAPTLREAWEYGSDFSRGIRVPDGVGALLHISGTAAVDEGGRSVAPGDLERQVDRTLLNVRSLLQSQDADFRHVVAMVAYLKDRRLLERYRKRMEPLGLLELPHAIVEAEICRPELLFELEATAIR